MSTQVPLLNKAFFLLNSFYKLLPCDEFNGPTLKPQTNSHPLGIKPVQPAGECRHRLQPWGLVQESSRHHQIHITPSSWSLSLTFFLMTKETSTDLPCLLHCDKSAVESGVTKIYFWFKSWQLSETQNESLLKGRKIDAKAQGLPWWASGWESTCQCRGHIDR